MTPTELISTCCAAGLTTVLLCPAKMADDIRIEQEDRELIQRMASKDAIALDVFYERYNRVAFGLVLRIGDQVQTTSGLHATIKRITDDTVDLEIANGVVTTWAKLAIRDRIEPEILDTGADEVGDLADDPGRLPND